MIEQQFNPLDRLRTRTAALGLPDWFLRQGKGTLTTAVAEIAQLITARDWALVGFCFSDGTFFPGRSGKVSRKVAQACQSLLRSCHNDTVDLVDARAALSDQLVDTDGVDLPRALTIIPLMFRDQPLMFLAVGSSNSDGPLDPDILAQLHLLGEITDEINSLRAEMRFLTLDMLDLLKSNIDETADELV